jgi:hypothetical protein
VRGLAGSWTRTCFPLLGQRGDLAVRKLNMVDWETPIAARYLKDIPAFRSVVVYVKDGKRVKALSGWTWPRWTARSPKRADDEARAGRAARGRRAVTGGTRARLRGLPKTRACRSRAWTRSSWRRARCGRPPSWVGPTWTRSTKRAAPTSRTATKCRCSQLICIIRRSTPSSCARIGEVGLTRTLGLELQVPFRVVSTTIQYTTPDGQPFMPLDAGRAPSR